jgi:hypothetical protein
MEGDFLLMLLREDVHQLLSWEIWRITRVCLVVTANKWLSDAKLERPWWDFSLKRKNWSLTRQSHQLHLLSHIERRGKSQCTKTHL